MFSLFTLHLGLIRPIFKESNNLPLMSNWHHLVTQLWLHCESKKHVDNFAKHLSIFKILSLIDSEQNFLQNKYCTTHHTLQMLLHYLVKLQCFKRRRNSQIHYRRTLFWSIFCECTCLISFSRQIRVSIENYEISVRIEYSMRDLIYDIHICAWSAMTQ